MDWKHWVVRLGLSLGIAGGLSETELHGQFSGDYETNTITTPVNWPGNYYVGSNYVGDVLEILPGGVLSNGTALIGYLVGADSNAAIVDGGLWLSEGSLGDGTLFIGVSGSGNQLTVTNGGMVFSEGGYLGNNDNSSNNLAVVTGTGSVWSNRTSLAVGFDSSGNRLIVTNGGAVFSDDGYVGSFNHTSSNNVATVAGNGALWEISRRLTVGEYSSNNTLNVGAGGSVVASNAFIGYQTGAGGNQINVTGGGLYVTNAPGTGTLDIRRGMLNLDAGMVMVDRLVATNGAASVIVFNGGTLIAHEASVSNSADFIVGDTGDNATYVADGGIHVINDYAANDDLIVGNSGSVNKLIVTNGSAVFGHHGRLGVSASSSNNVAMISGTGSIWNNSGNLDIGGAGSGNQLIVSNGGAVFNVFGGAVGGVTGNSNNIAVVTGAGSVWSNSTSLLIGHFGFGNQLVVTNGGTVYNAFGGLGNSFSTNNSVTVSGNGAKWEIRNVLAVGNVGVSNTLTIGTGGSVVASNAYVGFNALSAGNQINVTGGSLYVTNALGAGRLDVRRGALNLDAGTVMVDRLFVTNGANSVVLFNGGTLSTKGTTVSNGTVFLVGDGLSSATLSLEDGTHTFFDGLQISSNATLMGTGTIVGDLFTPGTLAPGHSPGLITVDGDLTMSNTTVFDIELGGLVQGSSYDFVHVTSNAILDGTLVVSFVDDFQDTVTAGDVFTNLTADLSLAGLFNNIASGNRLNTIDGYGSFLVTYDDGNNLILSDYLASPIPEPSALLLLGLGGMLLTGLKRRGCPQRHTDSASGIER